MNGLFKEYIWPIILIILAGLSDVLLRNFSIEKLKFLTEPFISINLIEIFILVLLVFYLKRFIPLAYNKRKSKLRAARLQNNWTKFKIILEQYMKANKDLQKEYGVLREKIREDLNYFLTDIRVSLKNTGAGYGDQNIILNNFQQCFEPTELKEWYAIVRRNVPRELDCFDYILAALVRHFDK